MSNFEVLVGNIGTVLRTQCPVEARAVYESYRAEAQQSVGRAAGEDVTLFKDGEIELEHYGWMQGRYLL